MDVIIVCQQQGTEIQLVTRSWYTAMSSLPVPATASHLVSWLLVMYSLAFLFSALCVRSHGLQRRQLYARLLRRAA